MDEELKQKLDMQTQKIEELLRINKKLYRAFQITVWITVVLFVVPLIGLLFVIPMFLSTLSGTVKMLGL